MKIDNNKPRILDIILRSYNHSIDAYSLFDGSIEFIKNNLDNLEKKLKDDYISRGQELPTPILPNSIKLELSGSDEGLEMDIRFQRYESETEVVERQLNDLNRKLEKEKKEKEAVDKEKELFLKLKEKYDTI